MRDGVFEAKCGAEAGEPLWVLLGGRWLIVGICQGGGCGLMIH